MNKDSDRLNWLRTIREKIVRKCDNDPKAMGIYFRKLEQQHSNRIFRDRNRMNAPETVGAAELQEVAYEK